MGWAQDSGAAVREFSDYRVKCLRLWEFVLISVAPVGREHEQVTSWDCVTLKEMK